MANISDDIAPESLAASKDNTASSLPDSPTAHINFPIEGESKWANTMRGLAFVTVAVLLIIGAAFRFLARDSSFIEGQQLLFVCIGIVFVLLAEYFVFLKIVIPRQANYGRYVINQATVSYYSLTGLGLGYSQQPVKEPMGNFMGVTTRKVKGRKNKPRYAVYLIHKTEKGKTINLKDFDSMQDAAQFARALAEDLSLAVALR